MAWNAPVSSALLRQAAQKGEAAAQYVFGMALSRGIDWKLPAAVADWCRRTAAPGTLFTRVDPADPALLKPYPGKDEEAGKEWLYLASDAGFAPAQYTCSSGWGLPESAGARLLLKAAEQDYLPALYSAALDYLTGTSGFKEDFAEGNRRMLRAAELGHAEAQETIGRHYMDGFGIPKDEAEGLRWLRKSADQGLSGAMVNLAFAYYFGNGVPADHAEAARWYRKAAEAGNCFSICMLGEMYEKGDGVPQDDAEAFRWYGIGAEKGSGDSLYGLGRMYENGKGTAKDPKKAAVCYEKAADKEVGGAAYALGMMYETGSGVPQDIGKAREWYRKAVGYHFPQARQKLKEMEDPARKPASPTVTPSGGTTPTGGTTSADVPFPHGSSSADIASLRKKAEKGDAKAQYLLGLAYVNGDGVEADPDQAYELFVQAAHGELIDAFYCVALFAEMKYSGFEQGPAEAAGLYETLAECNHTGAQYRLACLYEVGNGVPQDDAKAAHYFTLAASPHEKDEDVPGDEGHPDAMYRLGTMYSVGRGVGKDPALAAAWFRRAADRGHAAAQYALAALYLLGSGVRKNTASAKKLLRLSAAQGYTEARDLLAAIE